MSNQAHGGVGEVEVEFEKDAEEEERWKEWCGFLCVMKPLACVASPNLKAGLLAAAAAVVAVLEEASFGAAMSMLSEWNCPGNPAAGSGSVVKGFGNPSFLLT